MSDRIEKKINDLQRKIESQMKNDTNPKKYNDKQPMKKYTPTYSSNMPANVGQRWTKEEVYDLLQEVKKGLSHEEIAEKHERNVGGIVARLYVIAYNMHVEGNSMESIMNTTGLKKDDIIKNIAKQKELKNPTTLLDLKIELTEIKQLLGKLIEVMKKK